FGCLCVSACWVSSGTRSPREPRFPHCRIAFPPPVQARPPQNLYWWGQRPAIVVVAPLEALPRGPGFNPPRGRISVLGLKKLPRLSHVQSTVEPGLTHKATGPRVRVGQGFGGFLGLL